MTDLREVDAIMIPLESEEEKPVKRGISVSNKETTRILGKREITLLSSRAILGRRRILIRRKRLKNLLELTAAAAAAVTAKRTPVNVK